MGEIVINATAGGASLEALQAAGADRLDGKVLVDVANPLDFSGGMPPTLTVCTDDSLAEQIHLPLWLRLWGATQSRYLNIEVRTSEGR